MKPKLGEKGEEKERLLLMAADNHDIGQDGCQTRVAPICGGGVDVAGGVGDGFGVGVDGIGVSVGVGI